MSNADISKISHTLNKIHETISSSEGDKWTLRNAVFFASTVVTTIGKKYHLRL